MDFFAKHYEKLILAFCLVLLLVGIAFVALSASKTSTELAANFQTAKRNVEGGNLVEAMNVTSYNLDRYFNDPRKILSVLGLGAEDTGKGSMFEAQKMILCVNEECKRFILLSADECPFCKTKQPALAKNVGKDEDTDGDGIPDLVEQKYDFLNYLNPNDARLDQDNDGFLNNEEITAGTNPEDAGDFPPLALLLRVDRVFKPRLGITLLELEKNRSDDMNKWELVFRGNDPKTRRPKRFTVQVGETLLGRYKVTSAGFEGEGDAAIPYAVVVPSGVGGEEYTMRLNDDKVENKKFSIMFVYLRSRAKSEVLRFKNRMRVMGVEGQDFQLRKQRAGDAQNSAQSDVIEHYRVMNVDVAARTCQIAMLDGKGGKAVKTFEIPAFDEKNDKDFLFEENNSGETMEQDGPPSQEREGGGRPPRGRPRPR